MRTVIAMRVTIKGAFEKHISVWSSQWYESYICLHRWKILSKSFVLYGLLSPLVTCLGYSMVVWWLLGMTAIGEIIRTMFVYSVNWTGNVITLVMCIPTILIDPWSRQYLGEYQFDAWLLCVLSTASAVGDVPSSLLLCAHVITFHTSDKKKFQLAWSPERLSTAGYIFMYGSWEVWVRDLCLSLITVHIFQFLSNQSCGWIKLKS